LPQDHRRGHRAGAELRRTARGICCSSGISFLI
jgi:hypothetical protein